MAERPNAGLLKSSGRRLPGGSNPSPSAGRAPREAERSARKARSEPGLPRGRVHLDRDLEPSGQPEPERHQPTPRRLEAPDVPAVAACSIGPWMREVLLDRDQGSAPVPLRIWPLVDRHADRGQHHVELAGIPTQLLSE